MPARPKLALEDQMTVEEFLAFTNSRPEEERWELIEGVPVMNPSPVQLHQLVAANIVAVLHARKAEIGAAWLPMLGVGTRVLASANSLPQPDVYVQEHGPASELPITGDALAIFEVLSRSNTRADQAWRRRVYASVPNCQHYVTISLKGVEVTAYDRASGWKARQFAALDDRLELPALGVTMPVSDIYRWTPIGTPPAP